MDFFGLILFFLFLLVALSFNRHQKLKSFSFTFYVLAGVTLALQFPEVFVFWGSFETKKLIIPLLQVIMFGMGTTISLQDFYGVVKMPKGVLVGLMCQFSIMPLLGFWLGSSFDFPPEIAAGIILIGSCPGGLASNVMAYLAKANVALSITLTTISTLIAPFITPLLMNSLAGTFIPIDPYAMMLSITKMVILPVVLGLVVHHLFVKQMRLILSILPKISMSAIIFIIVIITANGRDALLTIGAYLFCAALVHNLAGYILGYWGCKILQLNEKDCRTIAFEVGMQNGGLASGIAVELGRVSTLGLAPAIFGPWMNVSGTMLASWWSKK